MKDFVSKISMKITVGLLLMILVAFAISFSNTGVLEANAAETTQITEGDGYVVAKYSTVSDFIKSEGHVAPTYGENGAYIFAGWYKDSACEEVYSDIKTDTTNAYAKFVPTKVLSAKLQLSTSAVPEDDKTNMRIVSSVDSLNYKSVGFDIYYNGSDTPITVKTTTVYERIIASVESGVDYNYGPKVVDVESKYFVTATLLNIKNDNFGKSFYIKPYWVTLDNTKVFGETRYVTVNNGFDANNINTPIYVGDVNPAEVTVKVGDTAYEAENAYYEAPYAHLNVTVEDKNNVLPSLTKFDVSGTVSTSFEYRNTQVQYNGTADTSWHNTTDDTFVILTAAELYGLAEIVNATSGADSFWQNKIYLGADITVNQGNANLEGWSTSSPYKWTPIGYKNGFKGVFDGNGHTISGIYLFENQDDANQYYGLFGYAHADCTIQNFRLENSYFERVRPTATNQALLGSVAGQLSGDMKNVYSNAIVVTENQAVGGLAGRLQPAGASNVSVMDNCWFDGSVDITSDVSMSIKAGGLGGYAFNEGTTNITNCLNTGEITYTYSTLSSTTGVYTDNTLNTETQKVAVGGVVGFVAKGTKYKINVSNTLNTGKLTVQLKTSVEGVETVTAHAKGGVAGFIGMNCNLGDGNGNTNVVFTNSISTVSGCATAYQRSGNTVLATFTNCISAGEGNTNDIFSGVDAWTNAERLGIYTNDTKDETKYWVVKEDGLVGLKTFTDKWIDFGWYYNHKTDGADTYVIETVEELYAFSYVSKTDQFKGETVKLAANIKMNTGDASNWAKNDIVPEIQFAPISAAKTFQGTFDGQGHTISGVYVKNSDGTGVGLFGQASGTVKNLKLKNSFIDSTQLYTGSVVGFLSGQMENVYSNAYVQSTNEETGGIVGRFGGYYDVNKDQSCVITKAWFDGHVESSNWGVGGIVGRVPMGQESKTIDNSLFTGSINSTYTSEDSNKNISYAGGIYGLSDRDLVHMYVTNCVSVGDITTASNNSTAAIIGRTRKPTTIVNAYTDIIAANTSWSQTNAIPGVGASSVNGSGQSVTGEPIELATSALTGTNAYVNTELDFYSKDNKSGIWAVVEDGTPVIKSLYEGTVVSELSDLQRVSMGWFYNNRYRENGTADKTTTFAMTSVADFYGFAAIVNDGYDFVNKTVELNASIDLNPGWTAGETQPANAWEPIGNSADVNFNGTFDGKLSTIKGVYVNTTQKFAGLFGYVEAEGTVENIKLDNSYLANSGTTAQALGGAVGYLRGNVSAIYATSSVQINHAATKATKKDVPAGAGGIVGVFERDGVDTVGVISGCWFEGTVDCAKDFSAGILGHAYKGTLNLENCMNTGTITSTYQGETTYTYVAGLMGGARSFVGNTSLYVNMKDCLNVGSIFTTGQLGVGSVAGRFLQATVDLENVYTVDNITNTEDEAIAKDGTTTGLGDLSLSAAVVTGSPIVLSESDLIGTKAYINTEFDFWSNDNADGIWAVTEGLPVIKAFTNDATDGFSNVQKVSKGWYYNNFTWSYNKTTKVASNSQTNYQIENADDMFGFAELVNNGTEVFEEKTVELANDIIFNEGDAKEWAEGKNLPTTSWIPIGNSTKAGKIFVGTFDGKGYEISGLYMNGSNNFNALFGSANGVTIQNLSLVNSFIKTTNTSINNMGSIIGYGYGTLNNIYSNAILHGQGRRIGGMIGTMSAATSYINSCWFDGVIYDNYLGKDALEIGGIVGYVNRGTNVIDTCLFTGDITYDFMHSQHDKSGYGGYVGGLCGRDYCEKGGFIQFKNCISAGSIHGNWLTNPEDNNTATEPSGLSYMGTVMGRATGYTKDEVTTDSQTGTIGKVYTFTTITSYVEHTGKTKTETTGYTRVDSTSDFSLIDNSFYGEEETLYGLGAYMWTELPFTVEDRGEEGPVWAAIAGQLPVPATLAENPLELIGKPSETLSGSGTKEDPWQISSVADLAGFAQKSKTDTFKDEYVILTNDIIMNAGEDAAKWVDDTAEPTLPWNISIGDEGNANGKRFEGTFDGQNYTISGICFENASKGKANYVGLFAATEVGSTVKNLRLENSYFEQVGTGFTGAVISDCRGTVSNVYSDAIVKSSSDQAGGIIGRANGYDYVSAKAGTESRTTQTIDNCWYDGDIILLDEARYGGGIIGIFIQGDWTLNNCVFTGRITQEYNGDSHAYVGGICGALNTPGTIATSQMESSLRLNSCISAGTIKTSNNGNGAGAIVGRLKANVEFNEVKEGDEVVSKTFSRYEATNLVINNVFATREAGHQEVGSYGGVTEEDLAGTEYTANPTITGTAVWTNNADRLVGYCTEEVKDGYYTGGNLDFNTFVIREEGVPVPNNFTDLEKVTPIANVDAILALTTMDSAWTTKNAVNYGLGHYVLKATGKTYDNYTAYLAALEAQGFTAYTSLDETGTDGVYNVIYAKAAGEWVLNVLFVQNTGEVTLTISNGLSSLSADLEPETSTTAGDVTLSMLQLEGSKATFNSSRYQDYYYGNSFVFKLPNGHFVINDGGNKSDAAGLMAYLRREAGLAEDDTTSKIYIDAWTLTHQHGDHSGIMREFVSTPSYANQLVVNAVYINEPNQKAMLCYPSETNVMNAVKNQYRGLRLLKNEDGNMPTVYWYQTGQTYYFDGLTMKVIQSQEQIAANSYAKRNATGANGTDYNTSSTSLLFTTANGKKVLITGDANYVNMKWMMNAYGSASQTLAGINVYQAMHHGKNTSYNITSKDNAFTDYIASKTATGKIDVTLFPCSVFYEYDGNHESYVFPAAGDANKDLIEQKSTQYFNYGSGTIKVTLGDTISAGVDTSIDTGTDNPEIEEGETGEQ